MTARLVGIAALAAVITMSCGDDATDVPTGPSSQSATATSSTTPRPGCTLPPAPTNLRVTSMVRTTVELSWNAAPGATGYTVMVGSTPGGSDELFQDTVQTSFRFTARDGRSFARVQANNACGGGPATGSIEFFVPG